MPKYSLSAPQAADFDFLKNIHHVTLKEHVSKIWGWDDSKQDAFFREEFESDQIQMIHAFEKPVGYLHLNLEENVLFIVNILILPEFQNRGLGSEIIKDLISNSIKSRQSLRLGVFKINTRARALYEVLGFQVISETETHFAMQL